MLCLVAARGPDRRLVVLADLLATTRLATGLCDGGLLDADARARTRAAVAAFAERARGLGARSVVALGTAAMRAAADGAAFAAEIEGATGVPVSILSGEDEARLAYEAVAGSAGGALLAVDVGGRSTELVLGRGSQIEEVRSLALGALALTEALVGDRPPAGRIGEVRLQVERALATCDLPARARTLGARVVASGGTATAVAALDLGLSAYDPERVHGHSLATERLVALALAAPASGTLDHGRRHILPAGAVVVEAVARAAGAARVVVSDHGIRHARLRALLAEDRP